MQEILERRKSEAYKELTKIVSSRLRSHQYEIREVKNGWEVYISYVPVGFDIPTKISYWDVSIKRLQ